MPLVSMTEMLKTAKENQYAVGQYNLNNMELHKPFYKQPRRKSLLLFAVFQKVPRNIWEGLKPLLIW